jgi:hypothetical protein
MALVHFDREGAMSKIWFVLAFSAIVVNSASAQDYRKNFAECVRELGLEPDAGYTHKLQREAGGRELRRWYFRSEAQSAVFNDCVARKARLAPRPSARPDRAPR